MNKIRIVLAEDHKMVRSGLTNIINSEPDMAVIGEAGDGREAIQRVQELEPDVLILDISMPDVSGLVAAEVIRRTLPDVGILILTQYNDKAYLQELLRIGISGYVLKQSDSGAMLHAVREIAEGRQYLDPGITPNFFILVAESSGKKTTIPTTTPLTDRETDVLRRVAKGYSNREIAGQLDTSLKTIELRKARALKKLNIRGRSEIVDYGILHGWFNNT